MFRGESPAPKKPRKKRPGRQKPWGGRTQEMGSKSAVVDWTYVKKKGKETQAENPKRKGTN